MSTSDEETPHLFDAIAKGYDWWSTLLSAAGIRAWHGLALELLDLQRGLSVLDVGCGTGGPTRKMARAVGPEGKVVGLDPSRGMLDVARLAPAEEGSAPLEWIEGRAEALPFPDHTFDRVTAQFSLRNTGHWMAALQEMVRVLKPQGRLLVLDVLQPTTTLGALALKGLEASLHALPRAEQQFYEWLGLSVRHAPTAAELSDAMAELGLEDIHTHFWLGDLVGVVYGTLAAHPARRSSDLPPVVVWAVDGSWAAYQGHRWLVRHLHPAAHVHVVTVIPNRGVDTPSQATEAAFWRQHWEDAQLSLQGSGFSVTATLLEGEVGPRLVEYAAAVNASALLLGKKWRSPLAEQVLGRVWAYVLERAPCPVIALSSRLPSP